MNVLEIKKYAESVLEMALQNEQLEKFLIGNPFWSVKIKNDQDIYEDCIFAKMEAIYKYYIEQPESLIEKKIYSILEDWTKKVKGSEAFYIILNTIEYQIVAENENRAPFTLDNTHLLENLKNNLMQNQELFKSEIYEKKNFWKTIEQHNESLSSNYGHKIL